MLHAYLSQVYGKCNHANGHGHNYAVEVTLYGPVDADTGMIMNLTDLKRHMQRTIMNELDHKNLDADVEWFGTNPSTTENVAIYIWGRMKTEMGDRGGLLHRVRIHETENNVVEYTGDVKDV